MTRAQQVLLEHFGRPGPLRALRVPGRVNLIGEHIDYAGLPVLPMAIQREIRVAYRPRADRTVRVANADPRFAPRSFELSEEIPPYADGDWGNYLKAAAQWLARRVGPLRGCDAAFDSTLPIAAGLSSSSGMVVAGALALLDASKIELPLLDLAEGLAEAERYVGTRGGGMDQAICLGAVARSASRVEFAPLRLTPVPVPDDWRFVVASSLVRAEKSAGMREAYNARRRDAERALRLLAGRLHAGDEGPSYRALVSGTEASRLAEVVETVPDPLLRRRFRHVVTEGARVHLAEQAMREGNAAAFGALMVESHRSLRDDFEVSCAELDAIVEIAAAAGAAGARLTGAGFGGCAVILCRTDRVRGVMRALADQFYAGRCAPDALPDAMFVAEPSAGASVTETTEVS